jgi:hypothetical protein
VNWDISKLTGERSAVVAKIESSEIISAAGKAFLREEIEALPQQFNGVSVNAHSQALGTTTVAHFTVVAMTVVS